MMIAIAMVMMAMGANAQTEFKAAYNAGDKATYEITSKTTVATPAGPAELNIKHTNQYEVKAATAEGFEIESTVTKADIEGVEDMKNDVKFAVYGMIVNQPIVFTTNAAGQPKSIKNWDEVSKKIYEANAAAIEKVLAAHPEAAQAMPKEQLIAASNAQVTEEFVLAAINPDIFDLNGKTLKSGDEVLDDSEGVKIKKTYTITPILGTNVVVEKSTVSMTEEETKAFIIGKLKESGAPEEQIKMIEANWQQMVAMGMAKVDGNATKTIRVAKNGWVQSVESTETQSTLGTEIQATSSVKLTDKNF